MDWQRCSIRQLSGVVGCALGFLVSSSADATIIQGGSTAGLALFDFETVPNTTSPWTPFATISGPGLTIGERLTGQTTTPSGDFDIVSGTPTTPLSIDSTVPAVFGFPSSTVLAISEWRLRELLVGRQAALSGKAPSRSSSRPIRRPLASMSDTAIRPTRCRSCSMAVQANLLDTLAGTHSACADVEDSLVFSVESGPLIAAITVNNTDPGGLGFDDIRYVVPEPSTGLLLALGLLGAAALRRRAA